MKKLWLVLFLFGAVAHAGRSKHSEAPSAPPKNPAAKEETNPQTAVDSLSQVSDLLNGKKTAGRSVGEQGNAELPALSSPFRK